MRIKHREIVFYVFVAILIFIIVPFCGNYISGIWMALAIPLLCIIAIVLIAISGSWFICPHCGMQTQDNPSSFFRMPIRDYCPHCGVEI